jgi:glucokinase
VNLGWGIYPVEKELEKACGLPVKAANDANIAALGEAWMGGGKGYSSVVMVTLGTGVGGGIVLNGKILTGFNGAAGEIGHIVVNPSEVEQCNCGLHGCLEQYASATGIIRMGKANNKNPKWKDSPIYNMTKLTGKDVTDGANAKDPLCTAILQRAMTYLGEALATIADVVNPEAILIGGGVSEAGEIVLDMVRKPFEEKAFHACKSTKVLLALLSNDAGIYGGAKLAIDSQE